MNGIDIVNNRISAVGQAKCEGDEIFEMLKESIPDSIRKTYEELPQEISSSERGLVIFNVRGDEVGRVQQDLQGVSYRVRHPELELMIFGWHEKNWSVIYIL